MTRTSPEPLLPTQIKLGPRSREMFKVLLWIVGIGSSIAVTWNFFSDPATNLMTTLVSLGFPALVVVAAVFQRRGQENLALRIFVWGLFVATLLTATIVAGVRTPNMAALALTTLLASWLLGPRQGIILAGISIVFVAVLGVSQHLGLVSYPTLRPILNTTLVIVIYLVVTAVFGITTGKEIREENALSRALSESLREELDEHRRAEQRFSALFRGSPLPTQISDTKGVIVDVNDVWIDTFGRTRAQAIGKRPKDLGLWVDLDDIHRVVGVLSSQGEVRGEPVRLYVADGGVRHFLITLARFETAETPLYAISLIDLTDRLAAEQTQRELNHQLEARVAERTRELTEAVNHLKRAQDELVSSEKLASLGAMVAGISHELNTPVGNTVTVSTALRQRVEEFSAEVSAGPLKRSQLEGFVGSMRDMATLLERSSLRAGDLITSFKQVAVDQTSEQRRHFDLRTLADDVVATVSPGFKRLPWTIEIDIPERLACDSFPGPLGQILTNLINNAANHAFEARSEGRIVIRACPAGAGHARLEVEDNGIGMSRQIQARVFDPFFTTKLGKGGSGLGLSVCHRLATTVLGGTLSLASEPDQGSTFTLLFPLVAPGRV